MPCLNRFFTGWISPAAVLVLSLQVAFSQTLTITNGVQKIGSLASTRVTLSNRCELWVTNSILAPIQLHDQFEFG